MLEHAGTDYPLIHLFDEPEFSPQDGYIGFMLGFFRRLRASSGWCSSRCTRTSAITSISCARSASASSSSRMVGCFTPRIGPRCIAHAPVRTYLGALAAYADATPAPQR